MFQMVLSLKAALDLGYRYEYANDIGPNAYLNIAIKENPQDG